MQSFLNGVAFGVGFFCVVSFVIAITLARECLKDKMKFKKMRGKIK